MDSLFGLDKPHSREGMELLTTAHDDVELSILCSILEEEQIPHLKIDRGTGTALRLITGYSMYGTDILVPAEEMERASEILDAYRNGEPVEETDDEDAWDEEDD